MQVLFIILPKDELHVWGIKQHVKFILVIVHNLHSDKKARMQIDTFT